MVPEDEPDDEEMDMQLKAHDAIYGDEALVLNIEIGWKGGFYMASVKRIDPETLAILSASVVEGNRIYLPPSRIDPKRYQAVNKIIMAMGGKWAGGKVGAHVFDADPTDDLDGVLLTASVEDRKQSLGFFETPAAVARRLIELADIRPGHMVLEPSAGRGAIVRELNAMVPNASVAIIEINPIHQAAWASLSTTAGRVGDFLRQDLAELYDRVIANPPFARQQDIDHVLHMHHCVRPGGVVVSVMSASVTFRRDKKTLSFCEVVKDNGGEIESLPAGSFRKSGTDVNTCIVRIPKHT